MVDKIDKIASEKFEEAKSIVQDSNCTIKGFDDSRMGVFRINAESQDGTTVMINCRLIKSAITGDEKISYEIRKDGEEVYETFKSKEKADYGIVMFDKIVEEIDREAQKEFKGDEL